MTSNPTHTRLPAVDALRGVVMVLMTVDHASYAFNAGRYVTDSVAWYPAGSAIPAAQFMLRWITHVCAPTFIFLAGLSLAFSIAQKQAVGIHQRTIDVDLVGRGLLILLLDPLWMRWGFGGRTVFQVLYAIGTALCCMVLVRRLGLRGLVTLGLLLLIGSEALAGLAVWFGNGAPQDPISMLLVTGGRLENFAYVLYPLLPWLAYMVLGFACGRMLESGRIHQPVRWFAIAGMASLLLFFLVRSLNGYGNMLLLRHDTSLLQWLHVSKYPPSLSFGLMTLGLMAIGLACLLAVHRNAPRFDNSPLLVFGRAPLLYYILHVHLLGAGAVLLGMWKTGGVAEAMLAAVAVMALLYPICRWYAGFKRAHNWRLLRYI